VTAGAEQPREIGRTLLRRRQRRRIRAGFEKLCGPPGLGHHAPKFDVVSPPLPLRAAMQYRAMFPKQRLERREPPARALPRVAEALKQDAPHVMRFRYSRVGNRMSAPSHADGRGIGTMRTQSGLPRFRPGRRCKEKAVWVSPNGSIRRTVKRSCYRRNFRPTRTMVKSASSSSDQW
jgi:hypothetical protein